MPPAIYMHPQTDGNVISAETQCGVSVCPRVTLMKLKMLSPVRGWNSVRVEALIDSTAPCL